MGPYTDMLQRQVDSLTQQVATMTESYQELIEDLRERNSNGLIFLPFETLHQKILVDGTFSNGIFAQITAKGTVMIYIRGTYQSQNFPTFP